MVGAPIGRRGHSQRPSRGEGLDGRARRPIGSPVDKHETVSATEGPARAGPVLIGILHSATGTWTLPIVLLAATVVPFTWAGLRISRPVYVDDELATR